MSGMVRADDSIRAWGFSNRVLNVPWLLHFLHSMNVSICRFDLAEKHFPGSSGV